MHIPDGFLSIPVWATMDGVALPSVAYLARRAQREFDHHKIPLLGVMGAFVFAAQLINFPVGSGTSAHLVGGALLAFTLGPAAASIVMTCYSGDTRPLVFQDGGLLAFGANVFNMAIAGVVAGYLPYMLLRGRRAGVFLGGMISVLVMTGALLALGELLQSGVRMPPAVLEVSIDLFFVSAVIEGIVTLAVMRALERIEPGFARRPEGVRGAGALALIAASLALAGAGVFVASGQPDGIQKLTLQTALASHAGGLLTKSLAGSHGVVCGLYPVPRRQPGAGGGKALRCATRELSAGAGGRARSTDVPCRPRFWLRLRY